MGEIDIVARDGQTLVFVEVKSRAYDDPEPEDQVNDLKRHQITKAAKLYLGRYGTPQPPARFDVVAVVWPNGRDPIIRHFAARVRADVLVTAVTCLCPCVRLSIGRAPSDQYSDSDILP